MKNYAFIDSQNLYLGIKYLNWKLDYKKFRVYLNDKYKVEVAYLFIGYISENQDLYQSLQKAGFVLIHKEGMKLPNGMIKGNCDAELVLQTMIELKNFHKAVIVSGDGDFSCLIKYLYKQNKLEKLLVPDQKRYSALLKKTGKDKIDFISSLKSKLEKNTKI